MRRTPLYMALYAATLLLLGGCRKDLCYDHPDHAFSVQVNLTATWEQEWERSYQTDWQSVWNPAWPQRYDDLRPDVPTGIRATHLYRAPPRTRATCRPKEAVFI